MRLFVSYSRVDKPFCIQFIEYLDAHETWLDQRLYAGQFWWKEILRRLDWCEGFIYLLSPESVESEYCRKEFEIAHNLGRHIFPVLIRENTPIPEFLTDLQYIDLSHGINSENLRLLLNSIVIAERDQRTKVPISPIASEDTNEPIFKPSSAIREAAAAMENGQYDQAVFLLKQLKSNHYESPYINIDVILKEAELALNRQSYLLEADREYRQIVELVNRKSTKSLGMAAFKEFQRDYPDYDPDNLTFTYVLHIFNEVPKKFPHYDIRPNSLGETNFVTPKIFKQIHLALQHLTNVEFYLTKIEGTFLSSYSLLQQTSQLLGKLGEVPSHTDRIRILNDEIESLTGCELINSPLKGDKIGSALTNLIQSTIKQLKNLKEIELLRYIKQTLEAINDLEMIAELDERFNPNFLRLSGNSDILPDVIFQNLLDIGREASSATAQMQGTYSRRLALQTLHLQVNDLNRRLQLKFDTFVYELSPGIEHLNRILNEHLENIGEQNLHGYRNPYIVGNPIAPERAALFKGRIALVEQILNALRSNGQPTFVLFGPRRMGKTSFLLQLQNLLPSEFIPVVCDAQGAGMTTSDANFFYLIARQVYRKLRTFPGSNSLPKPELRDFEAHPDLTINEWLEDYVSPLIGERKLFITIDEFEAIGRALSENKMSYMVLENLRHLMQHNSCLVLLFAGVHTIDTLATDAASYLIGVNAIEIGYLDKQSAKELILRPDTTVAEMPSYEDSVVLKILEITHCHPYLIQAICSKIIDLANRDTLELIDVNTFDEAIDKVFIEFQNYFVDIWMLADQPGQDLLIKLSNQTQHLTESETQSGNVKKFLHHKVIEINSAGEYFISIPLVKTWIERRVPII